MGITMWRQGDVAIAVSLTIYRSRLVADRHFVWQPSPEGMNLAKPEVVLSKDMLRVEEFSFSYRQVFAGSWYYSIVVEFILRETAIYQRGTDTRTETQDKIVQEFHLLGQNYQAGHKTGRYGFLSMGCIRLSHSTTRYSEVSPQNSPLARHHRRV